MTSSTHSASAPAPTPRLYFAYGSNLSTTQMAARCPQSTLYHTAPIAFLPGYRWVIGERGYANVLKLADSTEADGSLEASKKQQEDGEADEEKRKGVYGVLYTLTAHDEDLLDGYEGVPESYYKADLEVELYRPSPPSLPESDLTGHPQPKEKKQTVTALVYIEPRFGTGVCKEEYRYRMRRGLDEAGKLGLPRWWIREIEKWI